MNSVARGAELPRITFDNTGNVRFSHLQQIAPLLGKQNRFQPQRLAMLDQGRKLDVRRDVLLANVRVRIPGLHVPKITLEVAVFVMGREILWSLKSIINR